MHLSLKKDQNKTPTEPKATSHRIAVTLSEDMIQALSLHNKKQNTKPELGEPLSVCGLSSYNRERFSIGEMRNLPLAAGLVPAVWALLGGS